MEIFAQMALETSLVEWKHKASGSTGRGRISLETSLVEWKLVSSVLSRFPPGYLGNFLSGMETGHHPRRGPPSLPPWKLP